MEIMSYEQREQMKRNGYSNKGAEILIDFAHYNRFLETSWNRDDDKKEYVEGYHPTFDEYRAWKEEFEPWSYGNLDCGSMDWKDRFWGKELPMNKYYEDKLYHDENGDIVFPKWFQRK